MDTKQTAPSDEAVEAVMRATIAAYPVVNAKLRQYESDGMIIDRITYGSGRYPKTLGGVRYVGIEPSPYHGKACLIVHEKGSLGTRRVELAELTTITLAGVEHRLKEPADVREREDEVRALLDAV